MPQRQVGRDATQPPCASPWVHGSQRRSAVKRSNPCSPTATLPGTAIARCHIRLCVRDWSSLCRNCQCSCAASRSAAGQYAAVKPNGAPDHRALLDGGFVEHRLDVEGELSSVTAAHRLEQPVRPGECATCQCGAPERNEQSGLRLALASANCRSRRRSPRSVAAGDDLRHGDDQAVGEQARPRSVRRARPVLRLASPRANCRSRRRSPSRATGDDHEHGDDQAVGEQVTRRSRRSCWSRRRQWRRRSDSVGGSCDHRSSWVTESREAAATGSTGRRGARSVDRSTSGGRTTSTPTGEPPEDTAKMYPSLERADGHRRRRGHRRRTAPRSTTCSRTFSRPRSRGRADGGAPVLQPVAQAGSVHAGLDAGHCL